MVAKVIFTKFRLFRRKIKTYEAFVILLLKDYCLKKKSPNMTDALVYTRKISPK